MQGKDYVQVIFKKKITAAIDNFPGDLKVKLTYRLDDHNQLTLFFEGEALNAATLFNPTNHVYFNLGTRQSLEGHELLIASHHYLETDDALIPTGKKLAVTQTPYDFTQLKALHPAIVANQGFDTAFVIDALEESTQSIAVLRYPASHEQIKMFSDRNGLVIYTMDTIPEGIYFDRDHGKEAVGREGIAMEAQMLPDAINHDQFGDITLAANEKKSCFIRIQYEKIDE